MSYQSKQQANTLLIVIALITGLVILLGFNKDEIMLWPLLLLMALIAFLFHSLNIRVSQTNIHWSFGPGFWKNSIALSQIKSIKTITIPWYYGLGIRLIPTGWLYIVTGSEAVELILKNGKIISIGCSESNQLIKEIRQKIA